MLDTSALALVLEVHKNTLKLLLQTRSTYNAQNHTKTRNEHKIHIKARACVQKWGIRYQNSAQMCANQGLKLILNQSLFQHFCLRDEQGNVLYGVS